MGELGSDPLLEGGKGMLNLSEGLTPWLRGRFPDTKKPGADAPGERCSYADSNRDHRRRRPVLYPVKL